MTNLQDKSCVGLTNRRNLPSVLSYSPRRATRPGFDVSSLPQSKKCSVSQSQGIYAGKISCVTKICKEPSFYFSLPLSLSFSLPVSAPPVPRPSVAASRHPLIARRATVRSHSPLSASVCFCPFPDRFRLFPSAPFASDRFRLLPTVSVRRHSLPFASDRFRLLSFAVVRIRSSTTAPDCFCPPSSRPFVSVRFCLLPSAYLSRCAPTSFASSASRFNSSLPISRLCDNLMFDTASCNATIAR